MHLTALDYLAAFGAGGAAGLVNALAGGGTLISFPVLVGIGVPAVAANVTNTVSIVPGYIGGAYAQREDLRPQLANGKVLAALAAAGGLAGSVLLVAIPAGAFRAAIPYLILLACGLLFFQDRLRRLIRPPEPNPGQSSPRQSSPGDPVKEPRPGRPHPVLAGAVFATAVYGGFFGAGISIMYLAVLGLFSSEPMSKLNALKQALSFVTNLVAAVYFLFSGRVVWQLVPVMAVASVAGGSLGGRLAGSIDPGVLRVVVVVAGLAIAVTFWVT